MIRPGLTARLSCLIALVGILASGVTGYYAYSANRTLLVNEAERNLQTTVWLLGERFSGAISDVAADVAVLANMPMLGTIAEEANVNDDGPTRERLSSVFRSFMATHSEYLQVRMITRAHDGLELIRYDRDGIAPSRVDDAHLQEKGFLPYVFETLALAPGQIYISPIAVNHEQGAHSAEDKPTLRLAAPVANQEGKTVGVLVIDVDLTMLLARLRDNLPKDFQVYLANEWGDFLVHPDATQTFGFDKGHRIFMQDSFPATQALFDNAATSVRISALSDPQQAGHSVIAFTRRAFGASAGNRFIVLGVSMPIADVLVGARLLGQRIIRIVLVASILGLFLAILFSRALIRPLRDLTDAATHLFTAKNNVPLPLKRHDEIGALARCFDQMRLEIFSRIDSLNETQRELLYLSRHDVLTGLPNRMFFTKTLEDAIQAAHHSNGRLTVMFVDLDRFKLINDQLGHSAGDAVLVTVAKRLQQTLGEHALVARWGGDEFIILKIGTPSPQPSADMAAPILSALAQPMQIEDQALEIGASIGISVFPDDGKSAEELLVKADAAMYVSKAGNQHSATLL